MEVNIKLKVNVNMENKILKEIGMNLKLEIKVKRKMKADMKF